MFHNTSNFLPHLSTTITSKLPTATLESFTEFLEAERAYNATILERYETHPETSFELDVEYFNITDSAGLISSAIKNEALKDKLFFEKYLERLAKESNQQKILDDVHEETRMALYRVQQIHDSYPKKLPEYIIQKVVEPLQKLYDFTKRHISDYQKNYEEFTTYHFRIEAANTLFEVRLAEHKKDVIKKLEILQKIYQAKSDTVGQADIQQKIAQATDNSYIISVGIAFATNGNPNPSDFVLHRELFYYQSSILQNAKQFLNSRKESWSMPQQLDPKPKTTPKVITISPPIETPAALENPRRDTIPQFSSNTLISRATGVQEHFESAKEEDLQKPAPTLVATQAPQTYTATQSKEKKKQTTTTHLDDHSNIPATSIKKGKQTDPSLATLLEKKCNILLELFPESGNLKRIKIEEKELQNIILLIGGSVDNKREAVRRQVSYHSKTGFVPNSDCERKTEKGITFKMHYHTKNARFAAPEILSHYRDFYVRIGIAPYQLWPEKYPQQDVEYNKTTRKFSKNQ